MSFLLTLLLLAGPTPEDSVLRVSVDEARAALAKGDAVLVDVRGEVPYNLEHIRGAVSMPLGLVAARAHELPQGKLIVTYCACKNDELSVQAVLELTHHGVERAVALHGGIAKWKAAGLPVDVAPPDPDLDLTKTPPSSAGRFAVPPAIDCDRNDVTSYHGRVIAFSRTKRKTTIRIATDADTTETVTARAPKYLVNGAPMTAADWKRRGIGNGGRAIVWICRRGGVQPVIDWRPDERGPTGD